IDIHKYVAKVSYSSDFAKLKPEYLEPLFEKTKLFSQFLGEKRWFAGHKITIVDFLAYDILDLLHIFEPRLLDAFPNLKDFMRTYLKKNEKPSHSHGPPGVPLSCNLP
uniref:glutathione transferase n=1 Tax=Rhinolophus ferrumequinum TaxID=59479 RepID=A0A671EMU1_RHIFE